MIANEITAPYSKESHDATMKLLSEFLENHRSLEALSSDWDVHVSIKRRSTGAKIKMREVAEIFRWLVMHAVETTFQDEQYFLDFKAQDYLWRGEHIYLHPSEAMYICQKLLYGVTGDYLQQYMTNCRKRLGKDFLARYI